MMTTKTGEMKQHAETMASGGPRLWRIAISVVRRFLKVDGTSHTRSLGYQMFLTVISGFIGLVGLASRLHVSQLRAVVEHLAVRLAPGPSGRLLTDAARQGAQGGVAAMVVGLGAAVVAGCVAMSQVQRSANRLYGLRNDRPALVRWVLSLVLILSVGTLLALGGLVMASGDAIGRAFGWSGGARTAFDLGRWIVGPLIVIAAIWLLFRLAPHEGWTSFSIQAAGVLVAVILWILFTLALGLDLSTGTSSRTYGPLLAVVGLLVWSGLSALALHLGLATSATLAGFHQEDLTAKDAAD
jgi:YihY family inner membrane protein